MQPSGIAAKAIGADLAGPDTGHAAQMEVQTTVLIAARVGSHRSSLAAFLAKRGHRVVFADNRAEAVAIASLGGIDMVITGHTMPGIDGYALTRELRGLLPELPVILMSAGGTALGGALMDCVASLGTLHLHAPAEGTKPPVPAADVLAKLTRREREVLDLVPTGHANKAVARLLSISPRTVENHRAQIMRKTNCRCVADLVRLSLAAGRSAMTAVTGVP